MTYCQMAIKLVFLLLRSFLLPLALVVGFVDNSQGQEQASMIAKSEYFEFHSNYWINIHHFLYQQAQGSQVKKLIEDGNHLLNIGEDSIRLILSLSESEKLARAIKYYNDHLTEKSLSKLSDIRTWLENQSHQEPITDTLFTSIYKILNDFSHVYKRHYWPRHNAQNAQVLSAHLKVIKQVEKDAISKLEQLSGYNWPGVKVRVELTAYANYAGAYTVTDPNMIIFISSLDPFSLQSEFIETVFHEGSHLLFTRESPFRSEIYFKSQEMKMEFPKDLWHASQFYLCGRLIKDLLKPLGINHTLTMDLRKIFVKYSTSLFRQVLDKYYLGETNLESTVDSLLKM
jgi:hypothetical protein